MTNRDPGLLERLTARPAADRALAAAAACELQLEQNGADADGRAQRGLGPAS